MYQMSIFNFHFLIHCLWYNECPHVNITLGNLPFKIGFSFMAGRSVAWLYPYSLINCKSKKVKAKAKKCIVIYENWLIVAII